MTAEEFAAEIRKRKEAAGGTLKALAAELGYSQSTVGRWCRGIIHISPEEMADVLAGKKPENLRKKQQAGKEGLSPERIAAGGFELLRAAVLMQACKDYEKVLKHPRRETAGCSAKECEAFFRGRDFELYSDLRGVEVMALVQERARR